VRAAVYVEPFRKYRVINRWGRVGDRGDYKYVDYESFDLAEDDFKKKFQDKTKNKWEERDDFKKVNGKYDLVLKRFTTTRPVLIPLDTKRRKSLLSRLERQKFKPN
jgi:predicted DNA-binding WGR domain protein